MESQVQNESVVLRENSKRSLDMDEIINGVKNQYADLASRGRDEAEQWNQKKVRKKEDDTQRQQVHSQYVLSQHLYLEWLNVLSSSL